MWRLISRKQEAKNATEPIEELSHVVDLNRTMEAEIQTETAELRQKTSVVKAANKEQTRPTESTPLRRNVKRNATKIYYTQEQLLSEVDKVLTHLDQD